MTLEEAFEESFKDYWQEYEKRVEKEHPEFKENDVLMQAMKGSIKSAYKSGFYKARLLSLENGDLYEGEKKIHDDQKEQARRNSEFPKPL